MLRPFALATAALALAACSGAPPAPLAAPGPTLAAELRLRAPAPAEGTCWANQIRPAIIETVTEQVLLRPEQRDPATGVVTRPASFRTETRQQIVSDQTPIWFRTPCPETLTPDMVATLQRALKARGLYRGFISGQLDAATARALGSYQTARGLPSSTLALATLRELGLLAYETQG